MDLWQLHVFVNVVDQGSFSRAAEAVHLSQPTVSSHIKDLESHFGCRLIDRMGRKALPTRAGDILYAYSRRLLNLRDETEAALASHLGKPAGRLALGGSTVPGGYILPRLVGEFNRLYPDVFLTLVVAGTREIIKKTAEGEVELGMVGAKPRDHRLEDEEVAKDTIRLIVPKGHRFIEKQEVSLEDLAKEPFIIREPGSGTRRSLEKILSQQEKSLKHLNITAEMGSSEAVRQAVKAGVGVSILSTMSVDNELAAGELAAVKVAGLSLSRSFYLVRRRLRTASPLCAAFEQYLKKSLGADKIQADG